MHVDPINADLFLLSLVASYLAFLPNLRSSAYICGLNFQIQSKGAAFLAAPMAPRNVFMPALGSYRFLDSFTRLLGAFSSFIRNLLRAFSSFGADGLSRVTRFFRGCLHPGLRLARHVFSLVAYEACGVREAVASCIERVSDVIAKVLRGAAWRVDRGCAPTIARSHNNFRHSRVVVKHTRLRLDAVRVDVGRNLGSIGTGTRGVGDGGGRSVRVYVCVRVIGSTASAGDGRQQSNRQETEKLLTHLYLLCTRTVLGNRNGFGNQRAIDDRLTTAHTAAVQNGKTRRRSQQFKEKHTRG